MVCWILCSYTLVVIVAMFSGSVVFRDLSFGEGVGPIFLDRVSCSSNSPSLLECASNPLGIHTCSHSQDVGVQCIGKANPVSQDCY